MIKTREFSVPGEPQGKARPRATVIGGQPMIYTPTNTVEYEKTVKYHYWMKYHDAEVIPAGVPLVLTMECVFPIPKSATQKRRQMMLCGMEKPTKKPDCDNCLKAVSDALNGVAYHDDAQIVSATVTKYFGSDPMVRVWISQAE